MATPMVLDPHPVTEPPATRPYSSIHDATSDGEDDLYTRLKSLQRQFEFIDIQEEYVKDKLKNLRRENLRASVPLVIGQFMEMIDQNNAIVGSTSSNYYVRVLNTINRELLKPSASVALHSHSNALVDVLPPEVDLSISLLSQSEKPDVTYSISSDKNVFGYQIWSMFLPFWGCTGECLTPFCISCIAREEMVSIGRHTSFGTLFPWSFGGQFGLKEIVEFLKANKAIFFEKEGKQRNMSSHKYKCLSLLAFGATWM